ncbi:hypothetical protein A4G99_20865 [Haladaptatus sp. R4]|uniref:GIDE domain-containing protein n=1 Tax=Haladaptatus sp. R4 TaxID=1679489 RepID=UPI0007B4A323|nr:GIDE domain-containing protein [Haladaptatus sp. R4]KZN26496.1 hypothetical protein A4G99_20865 [Haladaptatus sp. R4]
MVQNFLLKLVGPCFGLPFAAFGCYMMYNGRRDQVQSNRIAAIETMHISDLQPGTVGVKGTAHLSENATQLKSPLEREDALAAHVTVEEWQDNGEGASWVTIHEEEIGVPMTVSDGTGEVQVELPADGGLDIEQTQTEVGSGDEPPERIQRYIQNEPNIDEGTRHHHGPLSIGDRRRYSEGVIKPGQEVYVVGTVREVAQEWGEHAYAIDEPTESGEFILSDRSKKELVQEGKKGAISQFAIGGFIVLMGVLFAIVFWINA